MNIVSSPLFDRQFKRLARKYPSLIDDLENLNAIRLKTHITVHPSVMDATKFEFQLGQKVRVKAVGPELLPV